MGVETVAALALLAAGTAVNYENTKSTARKQDNALAESLRNQGKVQRKADDRVNEEVQKLQQSRSDDERRASLDSFLTTLRQNRGKVDAGLTPGIGSDAFRTAAAGTSEGVQKYAADTAGLLSRIEAPSEQRRGEGFGYGNLATDIGLLGRESAGQNFIDELRLRAIRRSAGKDGLASLLMGAGSGIGAGAGGVAAGGATGSTAFGYNSYGGP